MTRTLATIAVVLIGFYALSVGVSTIAIAVGSGQPIELLGVIWFAFAAVLLATRVRIGRWIAPDAPAVDTTTAIAAIRIVGFVVVFWAVQTVNVAIWSTLTGFQASVPVSQLLLGATIQAILAALLLFGARRLSRWILGRETKIDPAGYERLIAIGAAAVALFTLARHVPNAIVNLLRVSAPWMKAALLGSDLLVNIISIVLALILFAGRNAIARIGRGRD